MTPFRSAASLVLLSLIVTGWAPAAEEPVQPTARERLKARIAEDAKKAPGKTSAANSKSTPATSGSEGSPTSPPTSAEAPTGASTRASPPVAAPAANAKNRDAATAKSEPTVLPKVEVKKSRITVLDHERARQDIDIAREKKNLEVSELDSALNDSKIARPLAIFGGDSTQFRKGVASERVQLMEAEKDLIEAIAYAKTKEEKAALQKQLNELKAMRRELDKSMR
jgi:hypothetical protein